MNILFANYGDFTSNSLGHIAPFAAELARLGHSCAVAVPANRDSITSIPSPAFHAGVYQDFLDKPACFPDGRGADLLHAWTPRENVRRFALSYHRLHPCRILIHLEDNEAHLAAVNASLDPASHCTPEGLETSEDAVQALSHPVRHRFFLRAADGITFITRRLGELVPGGLPSLELPPGLEVELFRPRPPDASLRAGFGLSSGETVLVYSGGNTFANQGELRELYGAVAELNRRGRAVRLIRTGLFSSAFTPPLPAEWTRHVLDLGFVDRLRLPDLLALSFAGVQPGSPGPFNDYRLPSKIPELMAMGLPLILPASNVGLELRDGVDALVLPRADASSIVSACERLLDDPELARRLGEGAVEFVSRRFSLPSNTRSLEAFYRRLLVEPRRGASFEGLRDHWEDELGLSVRALAADCSVSDTSDLADLSGLLSYFGHLQDRHLKLKPLYRDAANRLAGVQELLADKERSLESANERLILRGKHIENLDMALADLGVRLKYSEEVLAAKTVLHAEQLQAALEREEVLKGRVSEMGISLERAGEKEKARQASLDNAMERLHLTARHIENLEASLADLGVRLRRSQDVLAAETVLHEEQLQAASEREEALKGRVGELGISLERAGEKEKALEASLDSARQQLQLSARHIENLDASLAELGVRQRHSEDVLTAKTVLQAEQLHSALEREEVLKGRVSELGISLERAGEQRVREAAVHAEQLQAASEREHVLRVKGSELELSVLRAGERLVQEEAAHAEQARAAAARERVLTGKVRELDESLSDTQRQRRAYQDKIARMQASFSWKLTMPLRALRRLLGR